MPQEITKVRPTSQACNAQEPVAYTAPQPEKTESNSSSSDTFTSSGNDQIDPSHDGQFTVPQAAKKFLEGLISPLKSIIEHPFITAGAMLVMTGLGLLVGTTVMSGIGLGFFVYGGAYAAYEFGKGILNFGITVCHGDKDGMENAFKDFGSGISGVAMTLFGARGALQVFRKIRLSLSLKGVKVKSPEAVDLARRILNGQIKLYDGCLDEANVMYDAMWRTGNLPYFLNISTQEKGKGLGVIAFLHFLSRVGKGKKFVSTDFTPAGQHLFGEVREAGLIEQIGTKAGLARITTWEVIGDPQKLLEHIAKTSR